MAKKINRTKLPKIVQLPSGSYTTKIFVHKDENGKRIYKSITSHDYDEVVEQAAQFKLDKKQEKLSPKQEEKEITLSQAMDKYIESKDAVLSPSTVREYKRTHKTYLQSMMNQPISQITQTMIQQEINAASRDLSPKSVRNIHSFLSAVLAMYRPELKLTTTLPKKIKPDIKIPTAEEMTKVFAYIKGTDMEIPIYLSACCGLRRSEIVALDWSEVNLKKRTINVKEALVQNDEKEFVRKATKSTAGKRTIRIFPFVVETLNKYESKSGPVVMMSAHMVYYRWGRILTELGIQHYRFHDLRHYCVSVMLSLNAPKSYIADYVGHETEDMIDEVYGHIMKEKKSSVEDDLQKYFTDIINPKCETKSET